MNNDDAISIKITAINTQTIDNYGDTVSIKYKVTKMTTNMLQAYLLIDLNSNDSLISSVPV